MMSHRLLGRGGTTLALLAAFTLAACSESPLPPPVQAFGSVANSGSGDAPYDASLIAAEQMAAPVWDNEVSAAADASSVELVVNGSFEVNGGVHVPAFAGWTTVGGAYAANWYADNGGGTPVSGFPQPPPPHGAFSAVSDEYGPSNMALFQNIAVPANLCKPLKLSFMEWHGNRAGNWSGSNLLVVYPNQHIRVDVMNPAAPLFDTGAGVIQSVFLSANPDPFVRSGYVNMSATLPVTLGGTTIRLRFAQSNTQYYQQVGIDKVSLQAEPDVTAPVISLAVDPRIAWPPNHKMVKVASGVSATDDCGLASFTVTVTSNEPANGRGDGNTALDHDVVPNGSGGFDVYVRAERSGTGLGRVYTIAAKATDTTGNTSTAQATVAVPHNK